MPRPIVIDEKWLREQYIDNELLQKEIAELVKCSLPTVKKYLIKYNIPIRDAPTFATKQRMRENHADVSGKNNPRYGEHCSEETRQKISDANRNPSSETREKMSLAKRGKNGPMFGRTGALHPNFGIHWSEETRQKMSVSHQGKHSGEKNPMFGKPCITSDDTKQKISAYFKGRPKTEEHKRKISESHKGLLAGRKHPRFGKPAAHARGIWYDLPNDNKIWLRSSYEVRVADALIRRNVNWTYESKAFVLGDHTYRPDFLIDNVIWLEVKGFINRVARKKLIEFAELYPKEQLRLVFLDDILLLESDKPIDFSKIGKSISEI